MKVSQERAAWEVIEEALGNLAREVEEGEIAREALDKSLERIHNSEAEEATRSKAILRCLEMNLRLHQEVVTDFTAAHSVASDRIYPSLSSIHHSTARLTGGLAKECSAAAVVRRRREAREGDGSQREPTGGDGRRRPESVAQYTILRYPLGPLQAKPVWGMF